MFGKLNVVIFIFTTMTVTRGLFGSKASNVITTTAPLPSAQFVLGHAESNVMVVMKDGCYMYYTSHTEFHHLKSHHGTEKVDQQDKIINYIVTATDVHEVDHHTIDHWSTDVQIACDDLPVFRVNVPQH